MILVTLIISQLLVNIWMYYAKVRALAQFWRVCNFSCRLMLAAKAVNCCAEVVAILDSGPDGGSCLSAADCRGFTGNCADIVNQFADLPVLPDYPDGMVDYICTAFPNDDNPIDSFIVGLSALPVAVCAHLCHAPDPPAAQFPSPSRCPPACS